MILTSGTTRFDFEEGLIAGKVRISTIEGSTVAVPVEDLLMFVVDAYVRPARRLADDKKDWRDLLASR